MTLKTITRDEEVLHTLEMRIEELLHRLDRLEDENRELKRQRTSWMQERERLLDKYQRARQKVSSALERVRMMEQTGE